MSFGTQELFSNVNIYIEEGQKVGVVGLNGAGKTTFFKILMGKEIPDSGKIILKNNARIEWLPQVIDDDLTTDDITVFEYLLSARPIDKLNKELSFCYEELAGQCDEVKQKRLFNKITHIQNMLDYWDQYNAENILLKIINGMNINGELLDKKINELSGGQKSKIAFAKLLYSKPEIILLDEPTNHLDKETKDYVIDYLKSYKGSVYIISHDVDLLNRITNKTLFLDKTRKTFELYDGNYDRFLKLYSEYEKALLRQVKIQEQEEEKLREIINKYANSSGKRKRMAQDREKKLEKLLENKIDVSKKEKGVKMELPIRRESSKMPLRLENVSFSYKNNDKNEKPLIDNLSFSLNRGERFLIVGKNGVGKSTLLKLIVGKLKPDLGEIIIGDKTDIGYYAQEHELLNYSKNILENFHDVNIPDYRLRSILANFLFTDDDVFKKIKILSPGERSRVALAKLVLSGSNFLVLDEPTNHLDPQTQRVIASTFKEFKGTMLVVSHSIDFVNNLGIDRILVMPDGKILNFDENILEHYSEINNQVNKKNNLDGKSNYFSN